MRDNRTRGHLSFDKPSQTADECSERDTRIHQSGSVVTLGAHCDMC